MTAKQPSELPIIFLASMVRAILAGTKTQTRRVVKVTHRTPGLAACLDARGFAPNLRTAAELCPYGAPGDRLWVRETWGHDAHGNTIYCADDNAELAQAQQWVSAPSWRPSIHMPRSASRITLEITAVRVERLQDITNADAIAEGVNVHPDHHDKPPTSIYSPVQAYRDLWDHIYRPGAWDANPWVWVIEFRGVTG